VNFGSNEAGMMAHWHTQTVAGILPFWLFFLLLTALIHMCSVAAAPPQPDTAFSQATIRRLRAGMEGSVGMGQNNVAARVVRRMCRVQL